MSHPANDQFYEHQAENGKECRYCKKELVGVGNMHKECYDIWQHLTFNGLEALPNDEDRRQKPDTVPTVSQLEATVRRDS